MYLTKQEELKLGEKIQAMKKSSDPIVIKEGQKAINTLVENYTDFVKSLAYNYKERTQTKTDIEDLIQDGMLGLMTAIYKYNPKRNNKFSTMAKSWILMNITRSNNAYARTIRLPENRICLYSTILKKEKELKKLGLTFSEIDKRICEELKITKEVLYNIRSANNPVSLNILINEDTGLQLGDVIINTIDENIVNTKKVKEITKPLSDKQKDAIDTYFKFNNWTIDDFTKKYKISRQNFYNILEKSMKLLKEEIKSKNYDMNDFYY